MQKETAVHSVEISIDQNGFRSPIRELQKGNNGMLEMTRSPSNSENTNNETKEESDFTPFSPNASAPISSSEWNDSDEEPPVGNILLS